MDILAHGLWAALGVGWLRRRRPVTTTATVAGVAAAVAPDLAHLLPVAVWALFGPGTLETLFAYATASPANEPLLPSWVGFWSHHLHCVMHSALVAGMLSLLLWRWRSSVGLVMAGWWLHIVIDVFTHSADFYPSPVLYPITQQGFDGLAWNSPWFLAANYAALVACGWRQYRQRR